MSTKVYDIPRMALSFGINNTTNNVTLNGHGNNYILVHGTNYETIVETANWANNVTALFEVLDPNGNVLASVANIVRNQVLGNAAKTTDAFVIFPGVKYQLTLNAVPGNTAGTGGIAYITTYYKAEK